MKSAPSPPPEKKTSRSDADSSEYAQKLLAVILREWRREGRKKNITALPGREPIDHHPVWKMLCDISPFHRRRRCRSGTKCPGQDKWSIQDGEGCHKQVGQKLFSELN